MCRPSHPISTRFDTVEEAEAEWRLVAWHGVPLPIGAQHHLPPPPPKAHVNKPRPYALLVPLPLQTGAETSWPKLVHTANACQMFDGMQKRGWRELDGALSSPKGFTSAVWRRVVPSSRDDFNLDHVNGIPSCRCCGRGPTLHHLAVEATHGKRLLIMPGIVLGGIKDRVVTRRWHVMNFLSN